MINFKQRTHGKMVANTSIKIFLYQDDVVAVMKYFRCSHDKAVARIKYELANTWNDCVGMAIGEDEPGQFTICCEPSNPVYQFQSYFNV